MRRGAVGGFLALLLGACSVVGPEAPAPVPAPPGRTAPVRAPAGTDLGARPLREFEEVRGLWVVRSTMTSEAEVVRMVDEAAAAGFNTLLVQVRGRADAFYDSRWEPRGETLTARADFDPLARVIEEAHARGMAVHAWVNTHLAWSGPRLPTSPEHLVHRHPDWLAVPESLGRELHGMDPADPAFAERLRRYASDNSGTVEGMYTSPSHPAVAERVYSVWIDLAERYDLDGIHFDYIRFPSSDFDYSRGALDRFRAWVAPRLSPGRVAELEAAAERDPYAWVIALPGPWAEFRRSRITELVRRIYHGVKARNPSLTVSAAVFSNQDDAFRHRFQDWPSWLAEGILDVAVPMAYTTNGDRFTAQIRDARAAAGDRSRLWAGIGAYLNTADGTIDKIDRARDERAGGVVLFSYDWAANEGRGDVSEPYLIRIGRARFQAR